MPPARQGGRRRTHPAAHGVERHTVLFGILVVVLTLFAERFEEIRKAADFGLEEEVLNA